MEYLFTLINDLTQISPDNLTVEVKFTKVTFVLNPDTTVFSRFPGSPIHNAY
jgi:hypothetical protein